MGSSPFITGGKTVSMNTVFVFLSVLPFAAAEPEPWGTTYYRPYLGYGLGYAGYGLGGYAGYGLGHGVGYVANSGGAVHVVGKRSAEPEPTAEADPAAWYYGGYGHHGYGYGHRYYGHGYYGRGYGYYGYPYRHYGYGYGYWG